MYKKILIAVIPMLFLMAIQAQTIDRDKIPLRILEKPDIVVEKMKLTREPLMERGKIRLKIELWLSNNSSSSTSCCPTDSGKVIWEQTPAENQLFRVVVFGRYNQGIYFPVAAASTMLGPNDRNKRYQFYGKFESKYTLQIKGEADPGNRINEKNENNNMKRMYWPLRSKKTN